MYIIHKLVVQTDSLILGDRYVVQSIHAARKRVTAGRCLAPEEALLESNQKGCYRKHSLPDDTCHGRVTGSGAHVPLIFATKGRTQVRPLLFYILNSILITKIKNALQRFLFLCPGQDSNLHASRRHHLKVVSLPISPPGQV